MSSVRPPSMFGRYELHRELASGGMASVHLGHLVGDVGFSRLVAIKRLHPQFAREPEFVAMLLDEAHLAARVRHVNVVTTLDVVHEADELFIVMEYIEGESLSGLVKALRAAGERVPLPIVSGVVSGLLRGLHAAHEARGQDGAPLGIVHRDVSPQNVLVGTDGVPRVVDFGIALANVRLQTTREGQFKGKLAYMAPEQLSRDERPTARCDVYAAGIVLWELCAGRRAFHAESEARLFAAVLAGSIPRLDEIAPWVPVDLRDVIVRAIAREPDQRYASALAMAAALERAVPPTSADEIGGFVERVAHESLAARRALVREIEEGKRGAQSATKIASSALPPRAPLPMSMRETEPDSRLFPRPEAIPAGPSRTRETLPEPRVARETLADPSPPRGPEPTPIAAEMPRETPEPKDRTRVAIGVVAIAMTAGAFASWFASNAHGARANGDPEVATVAPSSAPSSSTAPPEPEKPLETSSATTTASAPPRPAPAKATVPDPCVPPTYPDPKDPTIRRVKRGCFKR